MALQQPYFPVETFHLPSYDWLENGRAVFIHPISKTELPVLSAEIHVWTDGEGAFRDIRGALAPRVQASYLRSDMQLIHLK